MAERNDRKGTKMPFIKEILILCFSPLLYNTCKQQAVMYWQGSSNMTAESTNGVASWHMAKGLKAVNYGPKYRTTADGFSFCKTSLR